MQKPAPAVSQPQPEAIAHCCARAHRESHRRSRTRSPKARNRAESARRRKSKKARDARNRCLPPEPASAGKRIAFISSECTPLAQTGGLGDVVAGLSKALRKRGHDTRIIMPLYGSIDRFKYGITFTRSCCVHFGRGEEIWVGVFEGKLGDVPIWFVDYERYFGRSTIYDGDEDAYRFAVLSKAALQICKDVGWIPHVAHVHDWMTSLSRRLPQDVGPRALAAFGNRERAHHPQHRLPGQIPRRRARLLRPRRGLPQRRQVRGFRRHQLAQGRHPVRRRRHPPSRPPTRTRFAGRSAAWACTTI